MIVGGLIAAAVTAQVGTALDCAAGFDVLAAQVAAAKPVPYASADPLLGTSSDNDLGLYMVSKPGHPAHPVVVKRLIEVGGATTVATAACGWGDKAAFDALMTEIDRLNAALIARFGA